MEANKSVPARAEYAPSLKSISFPRKVLIVSVVLALAAWAFGYFSSGTNVLPMLPEVIPGTIRVEIHGNLYVGLAQNGEVVGYAAVLGVADGLSLVGRLAGVEALVATKELAVYRSAGFPVA